jgi:hypothetical protein
VGCFGDDPKFEGEWDIEKDMLRLNNSILTARIEELETAIRKHHSARGHDLCWLNDVELWKVLEDGDVEYPHDSLPPCDEFITECVKYWQGRQIK